MVDVTGINRDKLLEALWVRSKSAVFFNPIHPAFHPKFDLDEAKSGLWSGGYVDYACGRLIKAHIYGESNIISPTSYDRDNGQGAFEEVVKTLKNKYWYFNLR